MVQCCLEEGPHLLARFCSQSRVKTKWGPCPTSTLVSPLTCAGAAGITQKHPFPQLPSSHHFPGVADSGFLGREGGWKRRWDSLQKRPFPRIRPSLSATCYIPEGGAHSRTYCKRTVPLSHQQGLSGALGTQAGGTCLQGGKNKSMYTHAHSSITHDSQKVEIH